MNNFMTSIFGASWRTTLFGIIQLLAGTAVNYIQSLEPNATFNWSAFAMQAMVALLAFLSKDGKVTGGTVASGEKPNPVQAKEAEATVAAKGNG
jgi:hypothetical protein